MRNLAIVVALLITCPTWLQASEVPAASSLKTILAEGKEPVRIVCFGDSITGVYYHTGGKRAYPEMLEIALKRAYPKARVQVINAGISGHNTRNALARIDRDVLKHKPHLVTVMFGMNDLVSLPLAEFKANLEKIVTQCQQAGAQVILCTQNAVLENRGRPNKKLDEFTRMIRQIAKEHNLAVADCNQAYVDARAKKAMEFRLLMSDEIHPNMDGHKLLARVIARTISGKDISLADVKPPQPAGRTLSLLKAGKPVKVLAMPPYDQLIGPALKALNPAAKIEVTPWPVAGQSLPQIERYARKVRKLGMDLIVIAVPIDVKAASTEELIRSFSWVLNWSLSFGYQEWDCIAMPPSTALDTLIGDEKRARNRLFHRLIEAQHIGIVLREARDDRPLQEVLTQWFKDQAR